MSGVSVCEDVCVYVWCVCVRVGPCVFVRVWCESLCVSGVYLCPCVCVSGVLVCQVCVCVRSVCVCQMCVFLCVSLRPV